MSALSVPVNPFAAQAKPPSQANNNAPDEAATPFASVLQQKVQSGKDSKASAKPSEQNNAQKDTSATSQETAAPAETPVAAAVVINGDNAQTALQQFFPWMQALQNKAGQPGEGESQQLASDSLTQAEALVQQTASVLPQQIDPKVPATKGAAKAGIAADEAGIIKAETDSMTEAETAKLAAPANDALLNDGKGKHENGSFDAALQKAGEQLNTQATQTNSGTRSTGEATRIQSPLGTQQWQNEFGDRIQLMSRHNESRAELILTPPQLGRIEVSLNINGDQASAMFVSANPEVRAALEGAMDRLREVLANSGIALGQAQVGSESPGQSAGGEGGNPHHNGQLAANGTPEAVASTAWTRHNNNMLDVFA